MSKVEVVASKEKVKDVSLLRSPLFLTRENSSAHLMTMIWTT